MELQPYTGQEQALQTYQAPQITVEEAEKRQKDAEELEEKLKFIVNDVPDREYHVTGSNAGASSAEFDTYRNVRFLSLTHSPFQLITHEFPPPSSQCSLEGESKRD